MVHQEKPRPVKEAGVKHTECPWYDDCLTYAARRGWSFWSCGQCSNHMLIPVFKRYRFIHEYYEFLAEIYPEFREKYETFMGPDA